MKSINLRSSSPISRLSKAFTTNRSLNLVSVLVMSLISVLPSNADESCEVITNSAPKLNTGHIKGGVRVMSGESFNLTSGIRIDGKLIVPGNPAFTFGGGYVPPQIEKGTGSDEPDDYRITINNDASIGGIVTHTTGEALPQATAPLQTAGTRNVIINKASDSPGDFAALKSLTVNTPDVTITLPPGRYERITLNKGSSLTLQSGTAANPAIYQIERLDVNGTSRITVDGFTELRLANSLNLNGHIGNAAHPEWLKLSISGGSFSLNNASTFHGQALVPNGTLTLNGKSLVHGLVYAGSLTLNGESTIECKGSGSTPNLPPTASAVEISTALNQQVPITLIGSDPENAALTYSITSNPAHGTVTVNGNIATYTPETNYVGDDTFTYTVSDGTLTSAPAAVTIHVFQPNRAPTASSATLIINQGETAAPIVLSATDPEGDTITYQIVTQPTQGTLAGTAPSLTFNHTGERSTNVITDSFTYTAQDSKGAVSAPATITIQLQPVNRAPVSGASTVTAAEDTTLNIDLVASDPDGDALTFELLPLANDESKILIGGSLTLADGSAVVLGEKFAISAELPELQFTPDANFTGEVNFTYAIWDSTERSSAGTITIQVTAVNDAPVALNASLTTNEDQALNLQISASDVDGDTLTYQVTSSSNNGTLTGTAPNLTYTPNPNFNGQDSFTFTANDGTLVSNSATVAIAVSAVNDVPAALAANSVTSEDQAVAIQLTGTDADGDVLSYAVTTAPTHGTLSGTAPNLTYTPNVDFNGQDKLEFTVSDASSTSAPAIASITIQPVNDAPVASDTIFNTNEDQAVAVSLTATDVDADALTYTITTSPSNGTLSGTAPNFVYTPAANFNGQDSFSFTASDASLSSNIATVTINITAQNDAPTGIATQYTVAEDGSIAIVLTGSDPDGDALSFNITNAPDHGTLSGTAPNLLYTPNSNYFGSDELAFTVSDTELTSVATVVSLVVSPIDDAPVALPVIINTSEDASTAITLQGSDVDGDTLTYTITQQPTHGTLSGIAPQLTYTPQSNFHGNDSFQFTVSDGTTVTNAVSVQIAISSVNDIPVVQSIASEMVGNSAKVTLIGTDPDGDALTYILKSKPEIGTSVIQGNKLIFSSTERVSGQLRFTYAASDGSAESQPQDIVLAIDTLPVVNLLSPGEQARFATETPISIQASAHDDNGEIRAITLMVNGQSVAVHSGSGISYIWTPKSSGKYKILATALDSTGNAGQSSEIEIDVYKENEAPIVHAGSNRELDTYTMGPNLISNPGAELINAAGALTSWNPENGSTWVRANETTKLINTFVRVFPKAHEALYFFAAKTATNSNEAVLSQLANVTADAATIDSGFQSYLLRTRVYLPANFQSLKSDTGSIRITYNDNGNQPISNVELPFTNITQSWQPVAAFLQPPVGTRSIKVSLVAKKNNPGTNYLDVIFDQIELRAVSGYTKFTLNGSMTDDGLPGIPAVQTEWKQVSGPQSEILNPSALKSDVLVRTPGIYRYALTADDGEKSATDDVSIHILLAGDNAPPTISLADTIEMQVGLNPIRLAPSVVDDSKPFNKIDYRWTLVSGPGPIKLSSWETKDVDLTIALPGEYKLKLIADDGQLFTSKEVTIIAKPKAERPPLDLYIVIDHSGSMFGPSPGVVTDLDPKTAIYQARLLARAMIDQLDPTKDRISLAKNSGINTIYGQNLTDDLPLAYDKVIMPKGEPLYQGDPYGSYVDYGLEGIYSHVLASRRSEAKQIILHINDGFGVYPDTPATTIQQRNELVSYGTEFVIVSLRNLANDLIAENEIRPLASSAAHYLIEENPTEKSMNETMRKVASLIGLDYNLKPTVDAGESKSFANVNSVFRPSASFDDDHLDRDEHTFVWTTDSGPSSALISDPNALNPEITFTEPGEYRFKLQVSDGTNIGEDTVHVSVRADSSKTPKGLVGYWPFGGNAKDSIGTGQLESFFKLQPLVYQPSVVGDGLQLGPRTRQIVQTEGLGLNRIDESLEGFTVSFWCKSLNELQEGLVFAFQGANSTDRGFRITMDRASGSASLLASVPYKTATGYSTADHYIARLNANRFKTNVWHHCAITFDARNRRIVTYFDGKEESIANTSLTYLLRSNFPLKVAIPLTDNDLGQTANTSGSSTSSNIQGGLDELAFFNRPLSALEIRDVSELREEMGIPSKDGIPVVDAGTPIKTAANVLETNLNGFVTDDSSDLQIEWSKLMGPGSVTFAQASNPQTQVSFSAPGIYSLKLSAFDGLHLVEDVVELRIGTDCAMLNKNILYWYTGNSNLLDLTHNSSANHISGNPSYTTGLVGNAFSLTKPDDLIFVQPRIQVDTKKKPWAFDFWFRGAAISSASRASLISTPYISSGQSFRREFASLNNVGTGFYLTLPFENGNNLTISRFGFNLNNGQFHHFAFSMNADGSYVGYLDGVSIITGLDATIVNPFVNSFYLGDDDLNGAIDELTVYQDSLAQADVLSIYQAGSLGKCFPENNPSIVNAGADSTILRAAVYPLNGTIVANAFAGATTVTWSQVSGPVPAAFSSTNVLNPTVQFSQEGRYELKLTVTDGTTVGQDTVVILVNTLQNTAPTLALSAPSTVQLPSGPVGLVATVSDDGLPTGNLTGTWAQLSGPVAVSLTATQGLSVNAAFVEPGNYTFRLDASDGVLSTIDTLSIEVLADPNTLTNAAPQVEVGSTVNLTETITFSPSPVITDDGLPVPANLQYYWRFLSGPQGVVISNQTIPSPQFTFSRSGSYALELSVFDGKLVTTDVLQVTVSDDNPLLKNNPPQLAAIQPVILTLPQTTTTLTATFSDDGRGPNPLTSGWRQISGPALSFTSPSAASTQVVLTDAGDYVVEFFVSDGQYIVRSQTTIRLQSTANQAPVVNAGPDAKLAPGQVYTLAGQVTDDGLPTNSLTTEWRFLSAPAYPTYGDSTSAQTEVTFDVAGIYVLELFASDGQLSGRDTVTFEVAATPQLTFVNPTNGSNLTDATALEIQVRASQDGGAISQVEIFRDSLKLGNATLVAGTIDYFLTIPALEFGTHNLTAVATTASGETVSSTISFTFSDKNESLLDLLISSPEDGGVVTAPTKIIGSVMSNRLASWKLEVASAPNGTRKLISSGTTEVTDGELGTFDPSLLENGIYNLYLTAQTTTGLQQVYDQSILVEGNLKIGQFTMAFEDMMVPMSGIPITVTRTYDSRDSKQGDFGIGWNVGMKNIRIKSSSAVGASWNQSKHTANSGFFPITYYTLQPRRKKTIMVTFPDGRTESFVAKISVPIENRTIPSFSGTGTLLTLPEDSQLYGPITSVNIVFEPTPGSQGSLSFVDEDESFLWTGPAEGVGEITGFNLATLDPEKFRFTEPDGSTFVLDKNYGLRTATDTNNNTITITDSGIFHSGGESIDFARDASGKITSITDPSGKKVLYGYDAQNRLVSVTNRVGDVTTFRYEIPNFPNYLTTILDPRGIPAIRSDYDSDGRLISQTDAAGEAIVFEHDLDDNREIIRDRLGNATIHEYDNRGNVTRTINALGGVTRFSYDANDNETSTTSPLGFTTTRAYDANGNLLEEIDPRGKVTRYSYDSSKRPLTISDALGQTTALSYSFNGNLLAMRDPIGTSTGFGYDGSGNISAITDAFGTTTRSTHDAKGNELTTVVTDSSGNVIRSESHTYDINGNRLTSTQHTEAGNLVTSFVYDADNRVTLTTYPDGTTSETVYNKIGQPWKSRDAAGRETVMTYDARGNLTRTDYPDGTFTTSTYDVEGRQTASTDAAGVTTYTLYDALGRTIATILPDETMPATVLSEVADIIAAPVLQDNPRTITTYDADGQVIAERDANGNVTRFEYDPAGRRTATIDPLGNRFAVSYDDAGRQTATTDAKGNTTSYQYDAAGRLIRTDLPDGNHTLTGYDALGRRISTTDAEGNITLFGYDALGRLISVTDALGGVTRYGYDSRGLQTTQTDALGRITRYEYDSMGRRVARILPAGEREEMTYDSLGRLTAVKDFNGNVITHSYDPTNDRLLAVTAPANHPSLNLSHAPARYEFGYDVLGRRTSSIVKNASGTAISSENYFYDVQSRLTGYTGPTGSIGYGYDRAGNLSGVKSATQGGYDVSYNYDTLNRINQVYRGQVGHDANAKVLAGYSYDANGNLYGVGYANGVQHDYSYNAINRLTNLGVVRYNGQNSEATTLHNYTYALDKNGMRTKITEHSGRTINHVFDKLLRLKSEAISSTLNTSQSALGTLSYTYDAVGNRTSRIGSGTITTILPNQTHNFTANDHLTSDTYDANGNTIGSTDSQTATSLSDVYTFDNRLIRRTRADGKVIDITYNADGHRIYKHITQGGLTTKLHHYLTDSNNPTGYAQVIEEKDPLAPEGSELSKVHIYGHDLITTESSSLQSSVSSSSVIYYSYDGLGSVRSITDEVGLTRETYDFDAYGNLIGLVKINAQGILESFPITSNSLPITESEFLFTGEQCDADLRMYFLRARYLNTKTGRFHSQDTYEGRNGEPQTLHKYLYVHANPVMNLDPSGNTSLTDVATTVGTLVSLTSIGNVANAFFALSNAAENPIPDAMIVSMSLGIRARGFGGGGVANIIYFFGSQKMYLYLGGSIGIEPVSYFKSRQGVTKSLSIGSVFGISDPGQWSGLGFSATLPLRFARLLGRAFAGKNGAYGALMQLARLESAVSSQNVVVQFSNSTAGPSAISVGFRSSTFATDVGWLGNPIDMSQLASRSDIYLDDAISKVRSIASGVKANFSNALNNLGR